MRNRSGIVAALLLLGVASACQSVSIREVADGLRNQKVRTLVAEENFTLLSPYGPWRTQNLVEDVRLNILALETELEAEMPDGLLVSFVAVDSPAFEMSENADGTLDVSGFERPMDRGFLGYSTATPPTAVIFVAPETTMRMLDGRDVQVSMDLGQNLTLRHELVHVLAGAAGLGGRAEWFDEGLAMELEFRDLEGGELVPTKDLPLSLRVARDQHESHTLAELLAWEENVDRAQSGEERVFKLGRPLAHSLMRFLLERTTGESLRERFEAIDRLSPESILALESEWRAWLEELPAR